nr:hypothetical protein [uncultured Moellerella sp.]
MSPNFTRNYSKDLNRKPDCEKEIKIDSFYYLSREGDLLKITEFALIGSEYDYYAEIISMGCGTDGFFAEYAMLLRARNIPGEKIIEELLSSGMHYEEEDRLIGRIAYKDFTFFDCGITKMGKQIRGVTLRDNYQGMGVARHIYKGLLLKHNYLICDNLQTIGGASLWAAGMVKIGEVRIYDTLQKSFIDTLTPYGCGVNGIIPWSAQGLSQMDMASWEPRKLSMDSCQHIVNIISKDQIYDND